MTHDEAAPLLPELLRGGLDGSVRSDLAAHLAACEECRALSVAYDVLVAALGRKEEDSGAGHPPAREVVAFAVERDALPAPELERIGAHVRSCASCEKDVEMTRGAHRETRRDTLLLFSPARFAAVRPPVVRAAVAAAAAVLVLLGYPAWLGLSRLPRAARDASDLRAANEAAAREAEGLRSSLDRTMEELRGVSSWSGPVSLNVLESPVRGAAATRVLTLRPGQPFLLIAVQPSIPGSASGKDTCRFAIGRERDVPLWSNDLTVAQVREFVRDSGVVTLAVPAALLPPGTYRLTVTRLDARPGPVIMELPFKVARSD